MVTTSQTTPSPYGTTRTGNRTAYWAIAIAVLVVAALIYMFSRDNTVRPATTNAPVQSEQQARALNAPATDAVSPNVPSPSVIGPTNNGTSTAPTKVD